MVTPQKRGQQGKTLYKYKVVGQRFESSLENLDVAISVNVIKGYGL